MKTLDVGARIRLNNILFLTDFSEPSESALPFALAFAREYGARIHALHVLTPEPYVYAAPEGIDVVTNTQDVEVQRLEAQLDGVRNEVSVVQGAGVWEAVAKAVSDCDADMVVVGTHGRTGAQKLLLGSVAEEIFRRSPVPVLTIGPWARSGSHNGARFHRVLFATDFTPQSLAAAPYAVSIAQENEARLMLLHVVREPKLQNETGPVAISESDISDELKNLVPVSAEMWCRPETLIKYGDPAEQILRAAKEHGADFIVLGVRGPGHARLAELLGRTTAHRIVAHACCPVLTVRG
jgi:nucleotide-binding universal stress UspA family protein